jgi:hypothetical protein
LRGISGPWSTYSASLADYKAPDRVIVVDGLPLTAMMTMDSGQLAELAASAPAARPRPATTNDPVPDRPQPMNGARAS